MHILGGKLRGRPLKSPKGEQTRPTLALVRKAVFDMIQFQIEGATFLDLFAGSGAMGLEALSRGALEATLVDQHPLAISCIKENIRALKVDASVKLIRSDASLALRTFIKKKINFNIAYIDPPYSLSVKPQFLLEILALFDQYPLLKNEGTLFLEESLPGKPLPPFKNLHFISKRSFSKTLLTQLMYNPKTSQHVLI